MSVLKALMVAVSVAERKRDEARQVLQNAQAACQAAQGQLSQLEGYAEEIQERWGAKEGASLKPEVFADICEQAFAVTQLEKKAK